jgi:hypothetical protein
MHQTVEAIIYPDGRVEMREPVAADAPRRALVTILDEMPRELHQIPQPATPTVREVLRAAGLLAEIKAGTAPGQPLSNGERQALAERVGAGTPLSQIIDEDRDERF